MSAIVVGVDGSRQSRYAVEWAAREAVRRGCRLRIACTVPEPPHLLDEATAMARDHAPGVVVESKRPPGHAGDATMFVQGGGEHACVPRAITDAAIPLVIVWEPPPADRGEIAVVVDEPAIDAPATSFAFEEATLRGARLRMIQIWPYPAYRHPDGTSCSEWRERLSGVDVLSDIMRGDPAQVLTEAGARADLLVVGTGHRLELPDHPRCPLALIPGGSPPAERRVDAHLSHRDATSPGRP